MSRRRHAGAGAFFDRFRTAIARLPAGLIRFMPPATPEDLARAETALGRPLPESYESFVRCFDGADLFHESVIVAGVGSESFRVLADFSQDHPRELVFAESQTGDLFALDGAGRVLRRDEGAEERALAGSSLSTWLDAVVASERILFGPDGEYAPDVFDPTAQEVVPIIALRQAERALKVDPGAADTEHARGLVLARLDRPDAAIEAFGRAAALDPDNPWPWFDRGRTELDIRRFAEALTAFARAAELERGPTGARLFAWATRAAVAAGDVPRAAALREQALTRDPALVEGLRRAAREAAAEEDAEPQAEAEALLEAIAPGWLAAAGPRRLPIVSSSGSEVSAPALRPLPQTHPHRPPPGAPPRSGVSRRGSRH